MLDVSMLVTGTGLCALALTVLLDAIGTVSVGLELSSMAAAGSAVMLVAIGGSAFGLGVEGGFGAEDILRGHSRESVAVARALSGLAIGAALWAASTWLSSRIPNAPSPIAVGVGVLRAIGVAGVAVVPVLGCGAAYVSRRAFLRAGFKSDGELGLMYTVWAIATLVIGGFV